jgi:hypothetical protein
MSTSELENCINSLGHQLVFWTLVVAAGLVVEYTKPIKAFLVSVFKWTFGPGSRPHLDHVIIGGLLITIGVAAEGLVEFRASRAETDLRAANDKAFTELSTLTKNARNDARTAQQSASDATGFATKAGEEAKTANKLARAVEKQSRELRAKNLELAQELASIEKAAFPRRLRQKEFATKLKPFKGFPVSVETIADFEARRTATLIQTGLHMADWQAAPVVVRMDPNSVPDFFFPGVMIEESCEPDPALDRPGSSFEEKKKSDELWQACAEASESLVKGLNENGIEAHGPRPDPIRLPHNAIRVRVALKPMPGQPPENLIVTP